MDVEMLARIQFALTITFHYIYPPLSIGLGLFLCLVEGTYLKTRKPVYRDIAAFWTKVFALTFAIGVATGIVMEFEFGTNWAVYSRYVGDVFGSALAAEGIFAFFLESGFLALLLFGWNRIGPKLHFFSTVMVCLGAHFSAIWIVVANSWMQTPAGFHIVGEGLAARAEITDFWTMVFNPSSLVRLLHVVFGCWLAGAFLVISISAWYLLKNRHKQFSLISIRYALWISLVAIILQIATGHFSGQIIAKYQPAKLAAFEGLYQTQKGAPLTLFGVVNPKEERVDFAIQIPKLLSFLSFDDFNAEVMGLDQVPPKDRPNSPLVFITFRMMLATGFLMLFASVIGLYYLYRHKLEEKRVFLWMLVLSVLLPQIGNQVGWISAEVGRYPWIVQGHLRISEGLSRTVTQNMVLGSIIMFLTVYVFLFILFLYLLNEKIKHGPHDIFHDEAATPYHHLKEFVDEVS